ncbi:translesion error-prone DNA polymerase V autoproteolytic subunit [Marinospirillum sp.]|uniref:LexA family protein n=1 Tax=Marinospirillum sp. TaxID=2183934 RepID=UPI0028707E1C|nr:translesion error-prone DNA polymerase V autoproteolytic subunit [Marinospirillum sp.]MDR9467823.1 translesion error-prone DNA polymerase V autoproteolytic subunit [Marinospirillum sp.]
MDVEEMFASQAAESPTDAATQRSATGFPSPAADFSGQTLSLDRHLVRHPSATYFCRVTGHAMRGAGIHDGDLLVVDSSLTPRHEQVVVALLFGELVVRRLHKNQTSAWLVAETTESGYPPVDISQLDAADIFWGVVSWVLHQP